MNTNIDHVFWPVKTTELSIMSAGDPVNTSVIVADYPRLFPSSSGDQNCLQLSAFLTNDDMNFMNGAGDRLDGVLQEAAAEAGVNFVAAAISSFIGSAADLTPAGFPVNPPALPDPPGTPVLPADGIGTLTVQPVTAGSADCSGSDQAGQQVQVSGGGFVPGTSVQLIVSSPGFGTTGELQVGATTADGTGHIAATVRIPLSALGFTPSGASAGIVFLDAIGAGSAADHQDDVTMVRLTAHDSTCGTVDQLPFNGFTPPVANPPQVNAANPGRAVPVKFSVPGSNGTVSDVLAAGYPQSAPVSCTAPDAPTSGTPTVSVDNGSTAPSDEYNYIWKTDRSWTGCRSLIVKLVDGTYHRAVFNFGS